MSGFLKKIEFLKRMVIRSTDVKYTQTYHLYYTLPLYLSTNEVLILFFSTLRSVYFVNSFLPF